MASHGLTPIPRQELAARHARLGATLAAAGLDAVLIATSGNLFYLTGLALDSYLWVDAAGAATWMVKRGLARAESESDFPGRIAALRTMKQIPELVGARAARLGLELDTVPVTVFERLRETFGSTTVTVDASELLREQRAIKSSWELDQIRAAAAMSEETFAGIPALLAPGRQEVEVAADIECRIRAEGHPMMFPVHRWGQRLFPVYLCSGATATLPGVFMGPIGGAGLSGADPHGVGRKKLARNEPIIADICCAHGGYISDQTVTFVIGKLPEDMQRAHQVSLAIRDEVASMFRPGTPRTAPYERALAMAAEAGLADGFMGLGTDRLSFVGHGLGIEIDEQPIIAPRQQGELAAGMVIACEPKFFFPGRGAVGIEDTYHVRAEGIERITRGPDAIVSV